MSVDLFVYLFIFWWLWPSNIAESIASYNCSVGTDQTKILSIDYQDSRGYWQSKCTELRISINLNTHTLQQSVAPGMKYLADENHLQNTFTRISVEFFSISISLWLIIPPHIQLPEFSLLTELNERMALSLSIIISFWNHTYFVTGLVLDSAMLQFNV